MLYPLAAGIGALLAFRLVAKSAWRCDLRGGYTYQTARWLSWHDNEFWRVSREGHLVNCSGRIDRSNLGSKGVGVVGPKEVLANTRPGRRDGYGSFYRAASGAEKLRLSDLRFLCFQIRRGIGVRSRAGCEFILERLAWPS